MTNIKNFINKIEIYYEERKTVTGTILKCKIQTKIVSLILSTILRRAEWETVRAARG